MSLHELGKQTKQASLVMPTVSTEIKQDVLRQTANLLLDTKEEIKIANEIDLSNARDKGLSAAMIDRLTLDDKRIQGMARSEEHTSELQSH